MGDIKITDLHRIHETDETKGKYQVFHTEGGRVLQSMVLSRDELEQLTKQCNSMLGKEATEYLDWIQERDGGGRQARNDKVLHNGRL